MDFSEKLISLIKPHRCLYDCRVKEYKNAMIKTAVWDQIAKELNQTRDTVKSKWKNLKDGYSKYKKNFTGTGPKNPYSNWIWGPYLTFLDGTVQPRTIINYTPSECSSNDVNTEMLYSYNVEIEPEIQYNGSMDDSRIGSEFNAPSYKTTDPLTDEFQTSPTGSPSHVPKKRKLADDYKDILVDRILRHIENKGTKDSIDLLFSSYAKSLKRMKPATQASLKVKLAQMFAEAELDDMQCENHGADTGENQ